MAKGQVAKKEITEKILQTFDGSFLYNDGKEIRINTTEDGAAVQIKVTLTAAKVAVEPDDENAMPAPAKNAFDIANGEEPVFEESPKKIEATAEEKKAIADLMAELGL